MNEHTAAKRIGLDRIRAIFNAMGRDTLQLVDEMYSPDIVFIDPFHRIDGRAALREYYRKMYADVRAIRFDFSGATEADDVVLYWVMTYSHPRLRGGAPISLDGCTRLAFGADGKVVLHRDYFDAGALLYEHVPLLGRAVRFIRERV